MFFWTIFVFYKSEKPTLAYAKIESSNPQPLRKDDATADARRVAERMGIPAPWAETEPHTKVLEGPLFTEGWWGFTVQKRKRHLFVAAFPNTKSPIISTQYELTVNGVLTMPTRLREHHTARAKKIRVRVWQQIPFEVGDRVVLKRITATMKQEEKKP